MKKNSSLAAVVTVVVCCVVGVWFCGSSAGVEKHYEVQPQLSVPEYRTDAARAIDAYERLMERYMGLVESNLSRIGSDIQRVLEKLDSIDSKLTELSGRMTRIEKALRLKHHKRGALEETQPARTHAKEDQPTKAQER